MAAKITRTPDPNATQYQCDEIVQSDTLGTVRIVAYANARHGHGWSAFERYHVVAHIDDALTINGKTYSGVQADSSAYTDASGNLCGFRQALPECWRTPLTDSARTALMDAITPIVQDYIARHGGNEAFAKYLRNKERQSEARTLKHKAAGLIEDADALLSQIEA